MLRRRCATVAPGSARIPAPSGPRCTIASRMVTINSLLTDAFGSASAMPQIPHMCAPRTQVLCPRQHLYGTCVAFAARMARRRRFDQQALVERRTPAQWRTPVDARGARLIRPSGAYELCFSMQSAGSTTGYAFLPPRCPSKSAAHCFGASRAGQEAVTQIARRARAFQQCWI